MAIHRIRGQFIFTGHVIVTSGASYQIVREAVTEINKTSGSATTVTLPKGPVRGQTQIIVDGKGDAGTNNITIQPASGTILGGSALVISTNYGSTIVQYNGTEWKVVGRLSGGVSGSTATSGTGGAGSNSGATAGAGGSATSGTGGAGGVVTEQGGVGGTATSGTAGAGGAVNDTGGAGGAATTGTGGAGGSAAQTAGAGGAATGTSGTGGAGGVASVTSGAGGAATGTSGTAGVGGNSTMTAGAGGAGPATGTGGVGGNVVITAGAGGITSGAGTGGAGGNVNLVPGAGGTTTGGTTGAAGEVQFNGAGLDVQYFESGAPTNTTQTFFLATRAYRVKAVKCIYDVTAGGALTLDCIHDTSGAMGGGTSVLNAAFNLNTTARTVYSGALTGTAATLLLAAGDRLTAKYSGAVGNTTGIAMSVELAPM